MELKQDNESSKTNTNKPYHQYLYLLDPYENELIA